ncbi:MAG TPA: electron transport complex subunit RsxC [Gemmatimonadaceae bacterium]|jgi:Na+-translocating ferredoxin:NAD+ oxidoreductase subunit C|nr:electron transport complex subunit RsxC [Gemmatimonadaceae bacterium]
MRFATGFRHGVHPPEAKGLTSQLRIRRMPFPEEIVLPLRQHAGKPAKLCVKVGDRVERGDKVGEADGFMSVPIHASAAGKVVDVDWWPHPDGSMAESVRIKVDRFAPQVPRPRLVPHWEGLTPAQVVKAVQEAGVVGLGGAAFPTHVKLAPPKDFTVHTLIINGAECEPYLTSDHRTMAEYPDRVHFGVRVMMHALGVSRCVIGVELNKPDAIEALRRALPDDLDITVLPLRVKYPQGAEKMLIRAVTGVEVPSGQLPVSVGVVVQNVGSVAAIAEVFETGLPLIERIVTVSGHGLRKPANLIVPVGTKLRDLLAECGGCDPDAAEVIMGGPMMGQAIGDLDAPVVKGTTGIVVLQRNETRSGTVYPCIHCGRCLDACPVFLNPSLLGDYARAEQYDAMADLHLADCMLCGSCSYVCPSNIPLSQLFQASKLALRRRQAGAA